MKFLREVLFFDQLAAWTTYWPWSDLCRDFIRPCSIKSALGLSSYVPSQCLEWVALIDCQCQMPSSNGCYCTSQCCHFLMDTSIALSVCVCVYVCMYVCALSDANIGDFLFFFMCVTFRYTAGWKDYHSASRWRLLWIWNTVLEYLQYDFRWVKRPGNRCCII